MSIAITESELLEALAASQRAQPDGQTVAELAEATGVRPPKVLQALKELQKEGRLRVSQAFRIAIHGRRIPVPVYTILPKKRK